MYTTGCPAKHVPLLFFEFLSFLGVYKFNLGHFSTALFVQISKIYNFLLFGEILTKILRKYCRVFILKINISQKMYNQVLEHL